MRPALAVAVVLMMVASPLAALPAMAPGPHDGGDRSGRAAGDPDEWLTFKGDVQRTGVAASEAPSLDKVLWSVNYKGSLIYSSPTVWNGTVFVGVSGSIRAIWAKNGTERWTYTAPNPIHSSPIISDGVIYAGVNDFGGTSCVAVDARTGQELWKAPIPDFVTSTPLVMDDSVYAGCEDFKLYCLDRADGSERWNFTSNNHIRYGAIAYSQGKVFFGTVEDSSQAGRLYAVDAQTGDEEWNRTLVGSVWSSPTIAGGNVLVSTAVENSISPEFRNGYVYAFNVTTGTQEWRTVNLGMVFASTSVKGGRGYVGTFGKVVNDFQWKKPQMYCLDLSSGAIVWNRTVTHQGNNSKVWSSVTIAGSKIVFGDELGYINVWNIHGVRIWDHALRAGAAVKVTPAVASEMIFAGNTMGDVVGFGSQPDLSVNATAIELEDEQPHLWQRVNVRARISNIGDKTATGQVFMYNGTLDDWDTVINSSTVTLEPGRSTYFYGVWTAEDVGNLAVWVRIMDVRPNEADLENNEAKHVVEVLPPSEGWLTTRSDPSGDGFMATDPPSNNITKWLRAEGSSPGRGVVATTDTVLFPVGYKLVAMDRLDGTVQWSRDLGSATTTPPGVGDGAAMVGTEDGNLVGLDLEDGSVRFSRGLDGTVTAGPTLVGTTAFVGTTAGAGSGTLYALDTFDGSTRWSRSMNAPVRAHPASVNATLYAISDDGAILALNVSDGALQWQYPVGNPPGRSLTAAPLVTAGRVYVASSSGFVYCLDADPSDGVDEGKSDPNGSEYDVLWTYRHEGQLPFNVSPVHVSGNLVLLTEDDRMLALNSTNGSIAWSVENWMGSPLTLDPIAMNGTVLVGGRMLLLLSADEGVETWSYPGSATTSFVGSPAAVDGMFFATDARGIIFAFGKVDNLPPVARISSPLANAVFRINESITFDASTTTDDKELPDTSFKWDFGDGNISLSKVTSHRYTVPGYYKVVLNVTDTDGESDNTSVTIRILGNHAPLLDWWDVSPDTGSVPMAQFNFSVRYTDPDNDEPEYIVMLLVDEPGYQPLTMMEVDEADDDHTDGKLYYFVTTLSSRPYPDVTFRTSDGIATAELMVSGPTVLMTRTFPNSVGDIEVTVKYVGPNALQFTPVTSPPQTFPSGLEPIGVFVELYLNTTFLQWANISFNYTYHDTSGIDLETLSVYRWTVTDTKASWEYIPDSQVHLGSGVVTSSVPTLKRDIYTVLGNELPEQVNRDPVAVINVDGKTHAPSAQVKRTYSPGDVVRFSGEESTDPDGDNITYVWDFGDGSVAKGGLSEHSFVSTGNYRVELTVSDGRGGEDVATVVISVRSEEESTLLYILVLIGIIVILILLFYPKGGSMTPAPAPSGEPKEPARSPLGDEEEEKEGDEEAEEEESTELDDIIDELEEDRKG